MLNPQEYVYPSNYHDASNFIKIDSPYNDHICHIRKIFWERFALIIGVDFDTLYFEGV